MDLLDKIGWLVGVTTTSLVVNNETNPNSSKEELSLQKYPKRALQSKGCRKETPKIGILIVE